MLDNILASNIHISMSSLQIFCIAVNIGKAPALIKSKIQKLSKRLINSVYQYVELYKNIFITYVCYIVPQRNDDRLHECNF